MEEEGRPPSLPMPVFSRLDRLERLIHYLEEEQSLPGRHSNSWTATLPADGDQEHRPLAAVLKEVPYKGCLLERVAMLENRVLQLSLEMGEGKRLDCLKMSASEDMEHAPPLEQEKAFVAARGNQEPGVIEDNPVVVEAMQSHQTSLNVEKRTRRSKPPTTGYRRWLGWFQLGC